MAGVGKHELKLAYELARSDDDNAPANTFCRAAARGPGAAATGASGAGEGEAEPRAAMFVVGVGASTTANNPCCAQWTVASRKTAYHSDMILFPSVGTDND